MTTMKISLATAIAELRKQIALAREQGEEEELKFHLGPIELDLQVQLEATGETDAGIKAWVVSLGASGSLKDTETHRVKLTLEPLLGDEEEVIIKRTGHGGRRSMPSEE
jgi:hypothetical protein